MLDIRPTQVCFICYVTKAFLILLSIASLWFYAFPTLSSVLPLIVVVHFSIHAQVRSGMDKMGRMGKDVDKTSGIETLKWHLKHLTQSYNKRLRV